MESSRTSLASRTSSKTHFQAIGLGLEASSPEKFPCPRLEDSTIFWTLKILLENTRNLAENLQRPFLHSSFGDRLKKFFWTPFFFILEIAWKKIFEDLVFWGTLAHAPLASSISVRGLERVCLRKGCPWPRIFFVSLDLATSLVSRGAETRGGWGDISSPIVWLYPPQ